MLLIAQIIVGYMVMFIVTMLVLMMVDPRDMPEDKFIIIILMWPLWYIKTVIRFIIWVVKTTRKYLLD